MQEFPLKHPEFNEFLDNFFCGLGISQRKPHFPFSQRQSDKSFYIVYFIETDTQKCKVAKQQSWFLAKLFANVRHIQLTSPLTELCKQKKTTIKSIQIRRNKGNREI